MIVGINYDSAGQRYIAKIDFQSNRERCITRKIAFMWKEQYDEVYIIDLDNTNVPFINSIVTDGCRM